MCYNFVQFVVYTGYCIAHFTLQSCAGTRLLRSGLLNPLLHHARVKWQCMATQAPKLCFSFQPRPLLPARGGALVSLSKGLGKQSMFAMKLWSPSITRGAGRPLDLPLRFLDGLNSEYQASSTVQKSPVHF